IAVQLVVVAVEVAARPVGADAVDAIDLVGRAGPVVPAVAAHVALGAGDVGLQLGVAVAAAREQLQLVRDGIFSDHIAGGVPFVVERALVGAGGEVVILDAHRGFGLDRQIAVEVHAQATGDRAGIGVVQIGVAQRAVAARLGIGGLGEGG